MGTKLNHLSALKSPCNQICDYLLIFELEGKDHAIFIELKKTLRGDNRPKDQLLRSLPLLKYLQPYVKSILVSDKTRWNSRLAIV